MTTSCAFTSYRRRIWRSRIEELQPVAETAMKTQEIRILDDAECGVSATERSPLPSHQPTPVLRMHPLPSRSRRLFLKSAIAFLGTAGLWLMDMVAKRNGAIPENAEKTVTVPWSAANGVRFYDRMIVVNNSDRIAVFSSVCTHLGCRISQAEGTELICPCHGSRFNQEGDAVHGPAERALRPLPFVLDRTNGLLRVTLEA
jgi:cytochrome b6-f complex iron-sulfur subunit